MAGRCAAVLLLLSFSAAAQTIGGGPFLCTVVSAGAPALIRSEAVADKINDILINCSGGVPGGSGLVNITVTLGNAVFTSRVVAPGTSGSEAMLIIDDFATAPAVGTNLIQGIISDNQAIFLNVPIVVPPVGATRTFRITNLRVNASSLPDNAPVQASVVISNGLLVQTPILTVGMKVPGAFFSLQDSAGNLIQSVPIQPGGGGAVTNRLRFAEALSEGFRKRNTGTSMATPTALSDQSVIGADYGAESMYYNTALPSAGNLNQAGLATQGTRLMARFSNIPAGTVLYVTTAALPNTGASSAALTAADVYGAGAFSAVTPTSTASFGGTTVGIAPVALTNGSGTATWEILDDDPAALESYTFGVVVAGTASGSATAVGGLGPIATSFTADATAPVPRFTDLTTQQPACGASSCITAVPSAISLSYQTGTAAPPPITLQVGATAGPLTVTQSVTAAPDGWLSVTPSSAVTPGSLQVTINPVNLPPAIYQATITLSSPGQTFSIPVIVNVTVGPSGFIPFGCTANVANPTQSRVEGMTEVLGDVVIWCTGGTPTAAGVPVPTADVKVTLDAPITSRTYPNGWSEALLMVDEPGSTWSATPSPQLACNAPSGSCAITGTGTGFGTYDGTTGRPNIFPGKVSGNVVTFPGVPLDPPPGNGYVRVLRIVNIRADASAYKVNPVTQWPTVTASISAGSIAVASQFMSASNPFPGLSFLVRSPDNTTGSSGAMFTPCSSASPQRAGVLRFSEGFASAFKTRTAAPYVNANTSPAPQAQNVPGWIYSGSEASFYAPSLTSPVVDFATVGLANFGTRLRARIDNIPAGAAVYVSTQAVAFSNGAPSVSINGPVARLVANETGAFAPAAATNTLEGIPAAELKVTNGSASAVWEVLNGNPAVTEDFDFVFWVLPGSTAGSATVAGSFAPAPPAFADTIGHSASSTLPEPRFGPTFAPAAQPGSFSVAACAVSFTTPAVLPGGTDWTAYSQTVQASGGTAPYSFSLSGGSLPNGLTLRSSGVLSGVPQGAAGDYTLNITATDANYLQAGRTFSLHIAPGTNPGGAILSVVKTHSGSFAQGQAGATYKVTVSNAAGAVATSGTVTVTETTPAGLTLVSMSGTGWTCPPGGNTCTRSDPLTPGSSYADIAITVNVAANAPASLTNTVTVSGGGSASASATDIATIVALSGLRFVPLTPCRIADTRNAAGAFGGPQIAGGTTRSFVIPNSACGVPANAQAYSLNVTVVPAGSLGYLTVWPAGQTQPLASTLNSFDGRIKSNAAMVPAGTGGAISVFASNATNLILDINGYFVPATDPAALAFYPLPPCRVADTRTAAGQLGGPSLPGGQSRTFPIRAAASCNIPPTAQAYSLNFAAVPQAPLGYITAWPTGQTRPLVSSLNAPTGTVTANAAIVPAGTDGSIDVFASNPTNLVIDINGYFAPMTTGGLSLYTLTPCRVVDTRQPAGTAPFSGAWPVAVADSGCGAPATAQAHVLSATVVPSAALGYLTLWPQGQSRPTVATLNALDGMVTSNLAIVPTTSGSISVFPSDPTHLVLDIFGYFAQ